MGSILMVPLYKKGEGNNNRFGQIPQLFLCSRQLYENLPGPEGFSVKKGGTSCEMPPDILVLVLDIELLLEAIHTSARIYQLLLAGKEGMAIAADFNMDIFFCRTGLDLGAAGTLDRRSLVLRMDAFFHYFSPRKKLITSKDYITTTQWDMQAFFPKSPMIFPPCPAGIPAPGAACPFSTIDTGRLTAPNAPPPCIQHPLFFVSPPVLGLHLDFLPLPFYNFKGL